MRSTLFVWVLPLFAGWSESLSLHEKHLVMTYSPIFSECIATAHTNPFNFSVASRQVGPDSSITVVSAPPCGHAVDNQLLCLV